MAITDTRPADLVLEATADPERFIGLSDHDPHGLAGLIGTGDHKALGRAWIAMSLVFGVADHETVNPDDVIWLATRPSTAAGAGLSMP